MEHRTLGTDGLEVSAIGLGTIGITMAYGEPDEAGGIVAIPGTKRPERMDENAAATEVVLTDGDLARITEIVPDGAYGSRYAAGMVPQWVRPIADRYAVRVSRRGPSWNPSAMSAGASGELIAGSPSTFSRARRLTRPERTCSASAPSAGSSRPSPGATSVCRPLPPRSR